MFSSVNTCWTLVGAFLVYFMQAGFALCEAGFTRAKNTGNILMKNMMDFCIGTPCYWLIGFGLMFGGTGALIGGFDPFIQGDYSHLGLDIPLWVYIVFQTVFCATAATIVSGSMAERTNFKAYCVYSAAISLVVYPICGHWMWGGGWLQSMGFHDFAGSAAVHNVGGVIAMLGAALLGPRIGKYDKDGKPHAIPGHNLTAGALGVFILWFCWFGFNGGSSLSLSTDETMTLTGLVCFNTNLAAAVSTCMTMLFTWKRYGKPDVSMTLNGSLAGLVAITAGCDTVSPFGAFIIGFVAGILVVLSVEFFDNIAKIDDPVGAVSVHFANGVWGTIAVGLFSDGGNGVGKGLFYGGGLSQLGIQLLGLIVVDAMFWPSCSSSSKSSTRPSASAFPLRWRSTVWTSTSTVWLPLMPVSPSPMQTLPPWSPTRTPTSARTTLPKLLQSRWTPLCLWCVSLLSSTTASTTPGCTKCLSLQSFPSSTSSRAPSTIWASPA